MRAIKVLTASAAVATLTTVALTSLPTVADAMHKLPAMGRR